MDRLADDPCEHCGEPEYKHTRERIRQEDGQYTFRRECPE